MPDVPELFPDLGPDDEQFVRALLQPQRADEPVPPAVAARWQELIGQLQSGEVPDQNRRTIPRIRWAGAVASLAAIALVAGIVVNSLSVTRSAPTVATGEVAASSDQRALSGPLPIARTVTTSGLQYQPGAIRNQIKTLINQRTNAGAPLAPDQTTAPATLDPVSQLFITNDVMRIKCFVELTSSNSRSPVLLDLGEFSQEPAALIAFATEANSQQLDIWVVRPSCTTGDPEILWFGRIQRP